MDESAHMLLLRLFRDMPDPRMVGKVSHKLHDILVITVCAVLCGLEHWTQIEDFGKAHRDWFATFHSPMSGDLNTGKCNAVFVDAHVQEVRSALAPDGTKAEAEFGQFEKYGWPHKEPY